MVEINITRMSSKGQIVIPAEMRQNINVGEKLILIKDKEMIIVKKTSDMDKQLKEDLEFARRTEEAMKRIERGEGIEMGFDDFIEEMKKW
ncbi:AbrB/MazE/SpoVT family DNA-binding domain-containing protein [archaeon]|nr:AbrB/MazE/SpoVT family DNA-binding domain-containing protein [archaeon]